MREPTIDGTVKSAAGQSTAPAQPQQCQGPACRCAKDSHRAARGSVAAELLAGARRDNPTSIHNAGKIPQSLCHVACAAIYPMAQSTGMSATSLRSGGLHCSGCGCCSHTDAMLRWQYHKDLSPVEHQPAPAQLHAVHHT
jgi:hypothetical protein